MRIAFVKLGSSLNAIPYRGDLTLLLEKMSARDLQYDIQAWDKADVDWSSYSLIILTSEINYTHHTEEFLQWIYHMENLKEEGNFSLWNSSQTIRWNYNKKYLFELESKNIKIPATVWLQHETEDLAEKITCGFQKFGKTVNHVVIKNMVGAGGTAVWKCKVTQTADGQYTLNSSDLEKIRQQMLSPDGKYGVMVQEFLPAILTEGEWSLLYFNKIFSHAVIKKPPPFRNSTITVDASDINSDDQDDEFRVQVRYGGYFEEIPKEKIPKTLIQFGDQVLAQVPEQLLHARVDIVMSEDREPHLMELEVLDPLLFITKPEHAENYLQAILSLLL